MTITNNVARNQYTATAGQTVFNYTFRIYADGDLNVYVTPSGQDPNDANDLTTDYVIDPGTIGNESGGFITFNSGQTLGDIVTIVGNIQYDRTVDYQNNGDFLPDTVNQDNDRQVSQIKQNLELIERAVVAPAGSLQTLDTTLPPYDPDKVLTWDTTDPKLVNSANTISDSIAQAEAAAAAALVSETNAAASESAAAASAGAASTSAGNAAVSETNAATSETNSANSAAASLASENKAQEWAENPEDVPVETGPDQFSAFHWAKKAEAAASSVLEEGQALASGQTVVTFSVVNLTTAAFYLNGLDVDNGRLFAANDYTVDSMTQVTLNESYPAGTTLVAAAQTPP